MCITTKKTGYRPMRVCVVCGARVSSVSTPKTRKAPAFPQSHSEPHLITMVSITALNLQFILATAKKYCDPECQGRPRGV